MNHHSQKLSVYAFARNFVAAASTVVVICAFSASEARAQKAGQATPCTVVFTNSGTEAIVADAKGAYVHNADGTRCTVNPSDGTSTTGDLLFTLNYIRAKTSRTAWVYLTAPADANSVSRGAWQVAGNFHLKIKGLRDMPIGVTSHVGHFHLPYGGTNYKLRFGADLGTAPLSIYRETASKWIVSGAPGSVARLWTGGGFGDGTVYAPQGDYFVPFTMTITLNPR